MKCLAIAAFLSVAVAAAAPKDILILHSYRVGYAWTDEVSRGFVDTFGQAGEFNLWSEFLDARRQSYPRNSSLQLSQIASRHQGRKFDLILAVDDEALDFIVNRSNGLFGSVPVVFCGINEWELTYKLPRNRYTGLLQKFPVDQVLSAISFIQPKTTDVFIVSDNTSFGAAMKRAFELVLSQSGKFNFHSIDGKYSSIEKIKTDVRTIAPGGIVVLSEIRQDSESHYVDRKSGEIAIAAVSSVPVLAVDISRVGDGILMGIPNGGFEHARMASQIGLKLLTGTLPEKIPVTAPGDFALNFDHAEMQRWNLSESQLPPGSQILNRPASIWREYRNWILFGIAVSVLQLLAIAALVVNVVRRRKIQSRLRDALRAANEAAALKSRFIANMSHELRTPMNGVLGLLHELQSTKLDPEQQIAASIAADSARSLLAVLNDILDISQIDAGRLKIVSGPFSLQENLPKICSLLKLRAKESGLTLTCEIDPSVPPLLIGDSDRLRQILINFSSNALKFTSKGGVRIEARQIGSDGKHCLIRIEVHDTGIGIAPDHMSRIFEPFTQVDDSSSRKAGGVGLGLAISKELVSLMGGKLGGESMPGVGSTFWIEIPFEIGIQPLSPQAPAPAVQERFDGRVVLLVEDNAVNRLVARKLLDRTGCRTLVAEDGEQCLLRLSEENVDLILMDVQMPGMTGLEATREIRRLESAVKNIPIVALTASSMPGDREQCIEAGMNDYLSKPIAATDLHLALSRWLGSSAGKQGANS